MVRVPRRSAVNLDSVESVSIAILVSRLGRLRDTRMREICAALAVAVDCSDCPSQERLYPESMVLLSAHRWSFGPSCDATKPSLP